MEQLLEDMDLEFFRDDTEDVMMDTDGITLTCPAACLIESQDDMGWS